MPAPANTDELLDLIQKSGVVDEPKLKAYVQKLSESTGLPKDPAKLAGHLVRDAVLTLFQAEQLLQGKYKRFSIGKYKVLEKLGAGGMAQVFLCEHKLMRRRVAIKVLPTAKADDQASLDRFYREARAVAAVDHPNIVRAYDIDQDENLHFLVMEYVDGTNLQDLIKKFGPLDILRACHYIYGAAIGLQHAHEMGLIHRDIKPGNILIDRSGVIKILDLGLARFFHDEQDELTKKYDENVLGTADYLAPEQALDSHTVDIRADIYSLGATFYYLLTGSALFPEGSVAQKLIWHQNRQPRPIRSLRPEVPEGVAAIVDKMMAKDPANRYQTPGELLLALGPWVATPIPPPSERELPQISPAAGGSRGPATIVGPSPVVFGRGGGNSTPDAPTVVASVPGTPTQPIPHLSALPNPASANPAQMTTPNSEVWESLDSETQTVAKGDTDRTIRQSDPPSRTRKQAAVKKPTRGPLLFVGIGILLLVGAAAIAYFGFGGKKRPEPPPSQSSHKIFVSTSGGESTVPTLRAALSSANPGDTIVINEAKLTESVLKFERTKHKDLTIESGLPDGKIPVIEFMGKSGVNSAMLTGDSIEGLHLKNIELDGKNLVANGIQLSGLCPGATIENVTVHNVKVGVVLLNAAGDASRPIVLDHLRTFAISNPAAAGEGTCIQLAANKADTKWVKIRNSRIEGPCKEGIHIEGAALDVEITGNRFFNLGAALSFGRPPTGENIKAQITANTMFGAGNSSALLLDLTQPAQIPNQPPPPPNGSFELMIRLNYFAKISEIGKANGTNGPIPGVTATENYTGPDTGGGNLGIATSPLPSPQLVSTNPADEDAKFLRFPGGPPEVGPSKVKVGAP